VTRQPGSDFTRTEAAEALRISVASLDYATKKGHIKCHRYGRHVTYAEHHLAAYRLLNEKQMAPAETRRLVNIVLEQIEAMRQLIDAA
jgi:hypothetical protein